MCFFFEASLRFCVLNRLHYFFDFIDGSYHSGDAACMSDLHDGSCLQPGRPVSANLGFQRNKLTLVTDDNIGNACGAILATMLLPIEAAGDGREVFPYIQYQL